MFWGKKQEEAAEDTLPRPVGLAFKVIELLEGRPGIVTKHTRNESTAGQDFAACGEVKDEYLEAPTALTQEQKALLAVACMVVNSYLTDYLTETAEPSEGV